GNSRSRHASVARGYGIRRVPAPAPPSARAALPGRPGPPSPHRRVPYHWLVGKHSAHSSLFLLFRLAISRSLRLSDHNTEPSSKTSAIPPTPPERLIPFWAWVPAPAPQRIREAYP